MSSTPPLPSLLPPSERSFRSVAAEWKGRTAATYRTSPSASTTRSAQDQAPGSKVSFIHPPHASSLALPLSERRTVTTHFLSFLSSPFPSRTLSLFHLSISGYSGKLSVDDTTTVTFSTSNRLELLVS